MIGRDICCTKREKYHSSCIISWSGTFQVQDFQANSQYLFMVRSSREKGKVRRDIQLFISGKVTMIYLIAELIKLIFFKANFSIFSSPLTFHFHLVRNIKVKVELTGYVTKTCRRDLICLKKIVFWFYLKLLQLKNELKDSNIANVSNVAKMQICIFTLLSV